MVQTRASGTVSDKEDNSLSSPAARTARRTSAKKGTKKGKKGSSDGSAGSSTTGSRPGLPLYLKKTLAKDIQRRCGGIHKLDSLRNKPLQKLLDSSKNNGEAYGLVGDPIRRQIQQKVSKWKTYSVDQWQSRVLLKYNISVEPSSDSSSESSLGNSESDASSENEEPPIPHEISTGKKATTPKKKATPKKTKALKKSVAETPTASFVSPDRKKPSPIPEDYPSFPKEELRYRIMAGTKYSKWNFTVVS